MRQSFSTTDVPRTPAAGTDIEKRCQYYAGYPARGFMEDVSRRSAAYGHFTKQHPSVELRRAQDVYLELPAAHYTGVAVDT